MISTYNDLKNAVADWLNRADLETAIPGFVALAEAQAGRRLRVRQMLRRATGVLDGARIALPSDFLAMRTVLLRTVPPVPLAYVTPPQADGMRAAGPGRPAFHTLLGHEVELLPVPDARYTVEIAYYARIPSLSEAVPANWLLAEAPDVYLYGTLLQSAPYLRDDERVATWAGLYERAVSDLEGADQRASYGGAALTIRTEGPCP